MIGLCDTSAFIGHETRGLDLSSIPDQSAVPIITIGELRLGALRAGTVEQRDQRLATLADMGKRMPLHDSWIAATALAHQMVVVTHDSDYDDVPGLGVARI